jgi:hypothetical protein
MKTLISLFTLAAIVFAYIHSSSLFEKGEMLGAYSLAIAAIASFIFWIAGQESLFIDAKENPNAA